MSREIVTRQEALAKGLKFYFTGKPCKHGHVSRRLAKKRTCYACKLHGNAKWRRENPERKAATDAKYRRENPEKEAARSARWRRENPEKTAAAAAKYRAAKLQRTVAWANQKAIARIYANAADLTEATGVPFAVDHLYALQGELVSGLHCEANLWAIPASLNSSKSNQLP